MSSGKERGRRKQGDVAMTTPSEGKPLVAPNVKKFKQTLNEISAEIKEKEAQRKQLSLQGEQSLVQLNSDLTQTTAALTELNQTKIGNTAEVRKVEDQVKCLGPDITNKKDLASKLLLGLRYKSAVRINDAVSKLKQQLLTRQYSGTEERRLQSEIDTLEGSKDSLREYLSAKEEIESIISKQEQLRERRNSLYRVGRELRAKEGEMKDRQIQLRKQIAEFRDQKRDLQEQKDALTQEIAQLYKKRLQLRDEFKSAQSDYITASNQLTRLEMEKKERESQREKTARRRRQALEADRRREMQYDEEKMTCKTLIAHLQKLIEATSSSVADSNGTPGGIPMTTNSDPQRSHSSPAATSRTRESSEFKPGVFLPRKKEDQGGYLVPSSSKRRSKREKKKHTLSSKAPRRIQYGPTILSQFEFLSIHPPIAHTQIEQVLQTLREKLVFYEDKCMARSEAGDSGIGSQALGDASEQELNSQEEFDPTSPNRQPFTDHFPNLSSSHATSKENTTATTSTTITVSSPPSSPSTPREQNSVDTEAVMNHSLSNGAVTLPPSALVQGVE